jgi:hypothetical protein
MRGTVKLIFNETENLWQNWLEIFWWGSPADRPQ